MRGVVRLDSVAQEQSSRLDTGRPHGAWLRLAQESDSLDTSSNIAVPLPSLVNLVLHLVSVDYTSIINVA